MTENKFKPGDQVYTKALLLSGEIVKYIERGKGSTRKTYLVALDNIPDVTDETKRIQRMIDEEDLIDAYDSRVIRPASEKPELKFTIGTKVVSKTVDGYVWGKVLTLPQADDPASKYLVRYVFPSANPESPEYKDVLVPQSTLMDGKEIIPISPIKGLSPAKEFSKGDTEFSAHKVFTDEIKADKIKVTPKFKVGDPVTLNKNSINAGVNGIVTLVIKADENIFKYVVEYIPKNTGQYSQLTIAETFLDPVLPKFAVGDRVVFVSTMHVDTQAIIAKVNYSRYLGYQYNVKLSEDAFPLQMSYSENVFEKVESDTKSDTDKNHAKRIAPKFKVGDKVIWSEKSTNKGTKGTIVDINIQNNPVVYGVAYSLPHFKPGESRTLFVSENYLEKDKEADKKITPKYKKGDVVGFFAGDHRGRYGTIEKVIVTDFGVSYSIRIETFNKVIWYNTEEKHLYTAVKKTEEKESEKENVKEEVNNDPFQYFFDALDGFVSNIQTNINNYKNKIDESQKK